MDDTNPCSLCDAEAYIDGDMDLFCGNFGSRHDLGLLLALTPLGTTPTQQAEHLCDDCADAELNAGRLIRIGSYAGASSIRNLPEAAYARLFEIGAETTRRDDLMDHAVVADTHVDDKQEQATRLLTARLSGDDIFRDFHSPGREDIGNHAYTVGATYIVAALALGQACPAQRVAATAADWARRRADFEKVSQDLLSNLEEEIDGMSR